jgi:PAS domain S-box-containing protein
VKAGRGVRRAARVSLASVCDRLPVGIALFDAGLRLAAWNARFTALRGYPRKLVKAGTPLEAFLRHDVASGSAGRDVVDATVRAQLAAMRRRRRLARDEPLPDGRCLHVIAERVLEGGLLVTCEDVTEARRTARRLRESEERHDFAMRAINEGMYDWDIANDTVHYSERAYQAVGMSPEDYSTARGWFDRIHPDDQQRYWSANIAHFKGETERFECDYRYRARDGSWRWARQHGLALRDASGRAIRLIGSTGDITELKERELQLAEQIAEQAAVRELLEAISRSAFDLDAVLRTLIESVARLCRADKGFIFRLEGDTYRLAFDYGGVAQGFRDFIARHPIRAGRDTLVGRTALTREVVHIEDVLADPEYRWPQSQRIGGQRTMLGVPIVRDGTVIGVIALWKERVESFTSAQIGLVRTFSSEALMAIENARLFGETKQALEQQTATAEVLAAISASMTDPTPVFNRIVQNVRRLLGTRFAVLQLLSDGTVEMPAVDGDPGFERLRERYPRPLDDTTVGGLAMLTKNAMQVCPVIGNPATPSATLKFARDFGFDAVLFAPMIKDGKVVGAIGAARPGAKPFDERQVALLKTFADQAIIAIENVRLFNELEARNRELTESLEQQTATAEILRVISGSPTDIAPVLDAVADNAARLCDANDVVVMMNEGDVLRAVRSTGPFGERFGANFTIPITRGSAAGRAVVDLATVQVPDFALASDEEYPVGREHLRVYGNHGAMATPLLRGDTVLGVIAVLRRDIRPFSDRQTTLLRTFADQAAIAIANVRLFNETKEALEKQTAISEILRVISASPTDVQPVFDAIVRSAVTLCASRDGAVFRYDGERLHYAAGYNQTPEWVDAVRSRYPMRPEESTIAGRAILRQSLVQIHDVLADVDYDRARAIKGGWRRMLAVPMLREGVPLGVIVVSWPQPGRTPKSQEDLLRTFADQAVIAIENARLFQEIQEKGRQLEIANQHKSAFLANMSHELRTPLNAVIGFSEMLAARYFGDLTEKQAEYVGDIHASGRHLLSLINDILDLSKIEAGRMELEAGEFDLRAALDNALTLVRERAQRGGVALRLDADPALGGFRGDERKLKQVVLNLLSNAVKFTPRGGAVGVAARRVDGAAEIAVSDTGVGIAPADQEAIFEAFRQVGTDITRKREGTGLGLALTRRFVELHGGTIRVESAPGRGSTFTVRLPIRHGE